jgi:predicted PP-loop superfamily ATPase
MGNFQNMEHRLDNWGSTVRSPKFHSGVCAQWARLCVALRDGANAPAAVTPVEKDGWLVEAAWSSMPDHVSKWVLKYTYVLRMSPEQVQTRMRKTHRAVLRGRNFDLVLAEAHAAISKRISAMSTNHLLKNIWKDGCKPEKVAL